MSDYFYLHKVLFLIKYELDIIVFNLKKLIIFNCGFSTKVVNAGKHIMKEL